MSSFQPNALPDGYILRLATEQDLIRIIYFECFSHDDNSMGRVLLLVLFLYMATIFNPEIRITILLIFIFGAFLLLLLLIPVYKRSRSCLDDGTNIFWIVHYENALCGYICSENIDGYNVISRLLIGNKYRNRRLGSNLLSYCISSVEKPIYLTCLLKCKTFYNRFGFVDTSFSDAPIGISKRFRTRTAHLMILNEISIEDS